MFIKDKLYLENGNTKYKTKKIKLPVVTLILEITPIEEMLQIFDDAITHGFEIIIEDGKFYYLE